MRQRRCVLVMMLWLGTVPRASAQDGSRVYAGAVGGVSTLSADGRASTQPDRAEASLYKPENGSALNLFVGTHVGRYLSIQGNYVWNRNELTLFSSFTTAEGGGFYEQRRHSAQHAVVGDALLYFRALGNGVRPYLSAGVGVVRFGSEPAGGAVGSGLAPPEGEIESARLMMRVAVGIDLAMGEQWSFRYSFSESISGNPISARLTPPGERTLANFQNLFGFVRRF